MKKLSSIIFALLFTCTLTLKITNIQTSDGTIVISIHDSDVSFSKRIPLETLHLNPESPYITYTLDLPDGEYAFCVFHDTNNDNDLNSNRLGIPKEPFGFSHYDGKSPPGNFKKHKVTITENTIVEIPLVQF